MQVEDSAGAGSDRPEQVPASARPIAWRDGPDSGRVAHRYGLLEALVDAGIPAPSIQVYWDREQDAAYWVVTTAGGRAVVLTDDTEDHAGQLQGTWPLTVTFLGPGGPREEIHHSIDDLTAEVVRWCTG